MPCEFNIAKEIEARGWKGWVTSASPDEVRGVEKHSLPCGTNIGCPYEDGRLPLALPSLTALIPVPVPLHTYSGYNLAKS